MPKIVQDKVNVHLSPIKTKVEEYKTKVEEFKPPIINSKIKENLIHL